MDINKWCLTEIKYLRGLVMADQLENDYEHNNSKIAQNKSMFDFTEGIQKKLDNAENAMLGGGIIDYEKLTEYLMTYVNETIDADIDDMWEACNQ